MFWKFGSHFEENPLQPGTWARLKYKTSRSRTEQGRKKEERHLTKRQRLEPIGARGQTDTGEEFRHTLVDTLLP